MGNQPKKVAPDAPAMPAPAQVEPITPEVVSETASPETTSTNNEEAVGAMLSNVALDGTPTEVEATLTAEIGDPLADDEPMEESGEECFRIKFSNGEEFEVPELVLMKKIVELGDFENVPADADEAKVWLMDIIHSHMSWYDFEKDAKLVTAKALNHFDYADNFLRAEFIF